MFGTSVNVYFLFSAEFIIHLAEKNTTFESFKKALFEHGAEFSDSFMSNLLRIIELMKPSSSCSQEDKPSDPKNPLATKFPGLAIPNDNNPHKFLLDDESDNDNDKDHDEDEKIKRLTSVDIFKTEAKSVIPADDMVDQAMAELEALAPSNINKNTNDIEKSKPKKERSRSNDRKENKIIKRDSSRDRRTKRSTSRNRRSRERDRDRKSRSRDRDRSSRIRDRRSRSRDRRSRSRDRQSRIRDSRRRSRSRNRHRSRSNERRSRSRHRANRSRSHGGRSRSRGKRSMSRERDSRKNKFGGDQSKKVKRKSPEVVLSDDPEAGKVFIIPQL